MGLAAGRLDAYGATVRATASPRDVEFRVFGQVTGKLRRAMEDGQSFSALAEALYENHTLWTEIAADLMSSENRLPQGLRVQILDLAKFTAQHTGRVLRGEGAPDVLVDINTTIMRGLRAARPAAEEA